MIKNLFFLIFVFFISTISASTNQLPVADIASDYQKSSSLFCDLIEKERLSLSEIESIFDSIQQELDVHRYRDAASIKREIIDLIHPIDPAAAADAAVLIDEVRFLLENVRIYYHNIQHTLEVTLGAAQAIVQAFSLGQIDDPKKILLTVTAALFHDVGYSNAEEILSYTQTLRPNQYEPLFTKAKGESFTKKFELLLETIGKNPVVTGAVFHQYHVFLGQIYLPHILQDVRKDLFYGDYLLQEDTLRDLTAIISLTDVKKDSLSYRIKCRHYLKNRNLSLPADAVTTSDLLTQLSTSDRLGKSLPLYHELFLGGDAVFWAEGLDFMDKSTYFYENIAKKQFDPTVMTLLDDRFDGLNPYRKNIQLIMFLYKTFEFVYKKIPERQNITEKDMAILRGLSKNGLQKIVIPVFKAVQTIRDGNQIDPEIANLFDDILADKDSVSEISLGDDIRAILIRDAVLRKDTSRAETLTKALRNPNIPLHQEKK